VKVRLLDVLLGAIAGEENNLVSALALGKGEAPDVRRDPSRSPGFERVVTDPHS
jgi:hypothetical protein